jgi:hypothetical protein
VEAGGAGVPACLEFTVGDTHLYNGQPIVLPDGTQFTNGPACGIARINTITVTGREGESARPE